MSNGTVVAEPVPTIPGTYYGELSPGGQWFWNGTGTPDDRWVATAQNVPEQLAAQPAASPMDHYILNRYDAAVLRDHSAGGSVDIGLCLVANPADVVSVFGGHPASAGVSISTLTPNTIAHGTGTFALSVTGTGFQPRSIVNFNGGQATTYVSATNVTCNPKLGGLKAGQMISVYVTNPDGTRSNTVQFSVT